jgi:hypothetical protein
MPDPPAAPEAAAIPEPLTRPEALALFWQRCAAVAQQIQELRHLQQTIRERWGRAPRLPHW